ncbi:hypothetical protein GVN18_38060 [Pseudomonas sp. ODNR1LW]|nr:hypothetical protein [Pseudomonas sp. ODNR1LW]
MSDAPRSEPVLGLTPPDGWTPPPADCDLSAYDWFPLKHKRLTMSAWWLRASDRAKALNIDLWCAAYQQVPAASLPDDDVALSDLAGFGRRDISAWLEVKAEVLACWILWTDGRWYHPTLAEVACEAWASRLEAIQQREADRERKRQKRGGGQAPDVAPTSGGNDALSDGRPADRERTSVGFPTENALKGQDKTGHREADASLSPRAARTEGGDGSDPVEGDAAWREVQALYGSLVVKGRGSPMLAKSSWLNLEPDERRALPAAIRAYAAAKPWGSSGPPGLARFLGEDFWREFAPSASVTSIVWAGPEALRAAVAAEMGDGFARSYLDPAEYRPAATPDGLPSLLPLNPTAASKLRAVRALAGVAIQDPILPRRHG